MAAELINGREFGRLIRDQVANDVAELRGQIGTIKLASIVAGDDPAAALFVRNQRRHAEAVGMDFEDHHLADGTSEEDLASFIRELNENEAVTGIIVQRPLPENMNVRRIQCKVHPDKDVEGMNPANMGFIVIGEPKLVPCTALASIKLLLSSTDTVRGKDVVVIGHSEIVGKPIAFMLLNLGATVTVCHVDTQNLAEHTRKAEVVFVAVGKPGLLTGDMLHDDAIVIDIGINQIPMLDQDGKPEFDQDGQARTRVVGDVDFKSASEVAGKITPVPGGVGPVTVATLLANVVTAARIQNHHVLGDTTIEVFRLPDG